MDENNRRPMVVAAPHHDGSAERRIAGRFDGSVGAGAQISNIVYAVDVCDVSQDGARVRIRDGLMPKIGETIALQFMQREAVEGRVVWSLDDIVGVQFDEPLDDLTDFIHFEDLGMDYFKAVLKFQRKRERGE